MGPAPGSPSPGSFSNEHQRKADLDRQIGSDYGAIQLLYARFQSAFTKYVQSGGVSQYGDDSTDPDYNESQEAWTKIRDNLTRYQTFNTELSESLQKESDIPVGESTFEKKQQVLMDLQSKLEKQKTHLEIAKSRQQSIPNATLHQSRVQGFAGRLGFTRPLKPVTIAILVGTAVFLCILTFLILRDFFAIGSGEMTYEAQSGFTAIFANPMFRTIVFTVSISLILFAIGLYIYFYRLPAF